MALLYPTGPGYRLEVTRDGQRGRLDLPGSTLDPSALTDAAFAAAVLRAAKRVGACVLHAEGVAGLPLESLRALARPRPDPRPLGPRLRALLRRALICWSGPGTASATTAATPSAAGAVSRWTGRCPTASRPAAGRSRPSCWPRPRRSCTRRPSFATATGALFGPLDASRQHVIAPAVDPVALPAPPSPRPLRHIAYVGAVHAHKGAHVFEELVGALAATPGLRFTVFGGGDPSILSRLRRLPRVKVRGYYRAGSLPGLLRRESVDLALLLSIWPETYGITLDECRARGRAGRGLRPRGDGGEDPTGGGRRARPRRSRRLRVGARDRRADGGRGPDPSGRRR